MATESALLWRVYIKQHDLVFTALSALSNDRSKCIITYYYHENMPETASNSRLHQSTWQGAFIKKCDPQKLCLIARVCVYLPKDPKKKIIPDQANPKRCPPSAAPFSLSKSCWILALLRDPGETDNKKKTAGPMEPQSSLKLLTFLLLPAKQKERSRDLAILESKNMSQNVKRKRFDGSSTWKSRLQSP